MPPLKIPGSWTLALGLGLGGCAAVDAPVADPIAARAVVVTVAEPPPQVRRTVLVLHAPAAVTPAPAVILTPTVAGPQTVTPTVPHPPAAVVTPTVPGPRAVAEPSGTTRPRCFSMRAIPSWCRDQARDRVTVRDGSDR